MRKNAGEHCALQRNEAASEAVLPQKRAQQEEEELAGTLEQH
jgi:hypothetical protein